MAMDRIVATLVCCLLAFSFAVVRTENNTQTVTTPKATTDFNLAQVTTMLTSRDSTAHVTDITNFTKDRTQYTSVTVDNGTFTETTAATTERTYQPQTSQSATTFLPLTDSTSLKTTTPTTQTPTFTALISQSIQTTEGNTSTPDTLINTTENSSHTATSPSVNRTTTGLVLNTSEKSMTIVFSVVLGVFAAALLLFMFHKCKHKVQFMHQPLHNTDNMDAFTADDDTLVISGGLYDGHPIYDNVPTATGDQSQFRLEFI